jgi:hypothetical protein
MKFRALRLFVAMQRINGRLARSIDIRATLLSSHIDWDGRQIARLLCNRTPANISLFVI